MNSKSELLFNFEESRFRYLPYPYATIRSLFSKEMYNDLVASFPSLEYFKLWTAPHFGIKYGLHLPELKKVVEKSPEKFQVWSELIDFIQRREFLIQVEDFLKRNGIASNLSKEYGNGFLPEVKLELSHTLAGGYQNPHTDELRKILTILIPMNIEGDWPECSGGRTLICIPRREEDHFDFINRYLDFEKVSVAETIALHANQGVIFLKTNNSWHAVEPLNSALPQHQSRRMASIIISHPI